LPDKIIRPDNNWEVVADQLAEKEFSIIENFLAPEEVNQLLQVIELHQKEDNFNKAGVGNLHLHQVNRNIRGDYVKWISKETAYPASLHFMVKVELMMKELNRLLFLSLKDYECHFAVYPPGSFYEKHIDQFKSTNNRKISFACYLNKDWQKEDGGELRLYQREKGFIDISPVAGSLALFRSDTVEHEVLTTQKNRLSITGWLRDRPIDLPFTNSV